MNERIEQMTALKGRMQQALDTMDWDAIQRVDAECRDVVETAMKGLKTDADIEVVRDELSELLALYRDLLHECRNYQNGIRENLVSLQSSRKNVKHYNDCP